MARSEKQRRDGAGRPRPKRGGLTGRIQQGFSRFLLWLSSVLGAPQPYKELLVRFLRWFATLAGQANPTRFKCLLAAFSLVAVCLFLHYVLPRFRAQVSPESWRSRDVAIWFSRMEDSTPDPNYLSEDAARAADVIGEALDSFDILACKPDEPSANQLTMNVMVGCYRTNVPRTNLLSIKIPGVRNPLLEKTYEDAQPIESALESERIARGIRTRIFETYPLRGFIDGVQSRGPAGSGPAGSRPDSKITLDIGRSAGVREGDEFKVLDPNSLRNVGRLRVVTSPGAQRAEAMLISGGEEIDDGYLVEWTKEDGSTSPL